MGCFWVYAAFCPSLALPNFDGEHVEIGEGTVASEIKILETLSVFIKNPISSSPPNPTALPSYLGEMSNGQRGLTKRLRQQTLKQPLDLPPRLGHPPAQGLDPRHHARKLFLQAQRWEWYLEGLDFS